MIDFFLRVCYNAYIIYYLSFGSIAAIGSVLLPICMKGREMIYDLQKASIGKRLSAYILDFVIFLMIAVGLAFASSAIFRYDSKVDELEGYYREYEERYGINIEITDAEFEALTAEEKAAYDAAQAEFSVDERVIAVTNLLLNLTLVIVAVSLFFAFLLLEFIIPLLFKNGQTVGKKIFGIGLMRDDGVKVTPVMMFVRSILGKYTVETMVPIFLIVLTFVGGAGIIGLAALVLLLAYDVILFARTKTHSFIHDVLAYTVAVDIQSQMIFETKEEMMAYKNKLHADIVDKSEY